MNNRAHPQHKQAQALTAWTLQGSHEGSHWQPLLKVDGDRALADGGAYVIVTLLVGSSPTREKSAVRVATKEH